MAAQTNLYVDQGSDFTANVDILQDNGDPYNLTAANVSAQMRRSFFSLTATPLETDIIDAANGVVTLRLAGNLSKPLRAGRYVYDVLVQQFNSNLRVLEGIITVYPQVTK